VEKSKKTNKNHVSKKNILPKGLDWAWRELCRSWRARGKKNKQHNGSKTRQTQNQNQPNPGGGGVG